MTVKDLIAALSKCRNRDAEVTVLWCGGEEVGPILTVDEDGPECGDDAEVHIVLEWQGGM